MKTIIKFNRILVIMLMSLLSSNKSHAQAEELQQLLLDIEKLTQFKAIYSDMKTGYQIYQQGYGTISGLLKGNFDLHNIYLTGLMAVSPAVRNNPRVSQIISQQNDLLTEYRKFNTLFRQSNKFSAEELAYIGNVYNQLMSSVIANTDDLANVTTAGKLRMSDDDRLRAIDRIYTSTSEQLQLLRWFNRKAAILSLQRSNDLQQTQVLKKLYGIN